MFQYPPELPVAVVIGSCSAVKTSHLRERKRKQRRRRRDRRAVRQCRGRKEGGKEERNVRLRSGWLTSLRVQRSTACSNANVAGACTHHASPSRKYAARLAEGIAVILDAARRTRARSPLMKMLSLQLERLGLFRRLAPTPVVSTQSEIAVSSPSNVALPVHEGSGEPAVDDGSGETAVERGATSNAAVTTHMFRMFFISASRWAFFIFNLKIV